jgi:gliding motility-associated-like protein
MAQENCSVPEPPVLNSVSVEPETGNATLNWSLSPSDGIAAYVLYTYNDEVGLPFDTIWDPSAISYTYNTLATSYFSISYVVAAHRLPNCVSPLSNHLNTIFAIAEIDTCNRKISLSWNSYSSEPKKVTGYTIMASVNGSIYSPVGSLSEDKESYLLDDFITDAGYCFYVIAELEDGTYSKSNKTCLSTTMQRPPDWINADYATVTDDKIRLSFTVDPYSEISDFMLERKNGTTGSFTEIAKPVLKDGIISYTDGNADVKSINFYRLSAVNSCNNPITISNLASNIVLNLERMNSNVILRWNKYRKWNGGVKSYKIFTDTGFGYREISEIQAADSSFVIDYHDIMYDAAVGELCFQVVAGETSNPYGIEGSSISQKVCTPALEMITVPDVFTPNNDLVNDLFRPVLSFTPIEFHLIISNRQGVILFETRDYNESWNGSQKGNPVPEGVYLWYLRVTTPSRSIISKTGTIAVYFNR